MCTVSGRGRPWQQGAPTAGPGVTACSPARGGHGGGSACPRRGLPAASRVTLCPRPVPRRPLAGRPALLPHLPQPVPPGLLGVSLQDQGQNRVGGGVPPAHRAAPSLRHSHRAAGLSLQDTRAPGPVPSSDTKQLRARGRCPRSKAHIPSSFCQLWVTCFRKGFLSSLILFIARHCHLIKAALPLSELETPFKS